MAALHGNPESKQGPTYRNDGEPWEPARESAPVSVEETKAPIYRRPHRGVSVGVLATRHELSRSRTERAVNEMRAKRLLEAKIEFVSDPGFDDPAAGPESLDPPSEPAVVRGGRRSQAPHDLPPYLVGLYGVALLSREQERMLFRKMNCLKYRAHQLRGLLDLSHCNAAQLDEIERLQEEALTIKNQSIRANLRLVVSIAKRHVGPMNSLFEMISDGNLA
jgi:RNA polymerase primary sigma factor